MIGNLPLGTHCSRNAMVCASASAMVVVLSLTRWVRPLSSVNARCTSFRSATSSRLLSTYTRARDSSALLSSNEGFSVALRKLVQRALTEDKGLGKRCNRHGRRRLLRETLLCYLFQPT